MGMAPYRPPFFLKLRLRSHAGVAGREHLFTVRLDSRWMLRAREMPKAHKENNEVIAACYILE